MNRLLAVVLAAVLSLASTASAQAARQDYPNEYEIAVPDYVTGPFQVSPTIVYGLNRICSVDLVTLDENPRILSTVNSEPFEFTVYPANGLQAIRMWVHECDGQVAEVYANAWSMFGADTHVIGEGEPRRVAIGNSTPEPATATLADEKGGVVATIPVMPEAQTSMNLPPRSGKRTRIYQLTVSNEFGTMQFPVVDPYGWSSMGRTNWPSNTYLPCERVGWWYNPSRALKKTDKIKNDIAGALKRIAAETNLTFFPATSPESARLVFKWTDMRVKGIGAYGGTNGEVMLNRQSTWTTDPEGGFKKLKKGYAGRGWLLVHEVMHTMGFGHSPLKYSVMYPTDYGHISFIKQDLEALHFLYPKGNCSQWPIAGGLATSP